MRWYIEISAEGQATQKLCLEAVHWQPALQKAREIQGEPQKLKGLSVEILEDGCRAVDGDRHVTYVVSSAPDDASLVESLGDDRDSQSDISDTASDAGDDQSGDQSSDPGIRAARASRRGRRSRRDKLSQRRKALRESRPPEEAGALSPSPPVGPGLGKKTIMLGSASNLGIKEDSRAAINTLDYASTGEARIVESDKPGKVVPPDPSAPSVEQALESQRSQTLAEAKRKSAAPSFAPAKNDGKSDAPPKIEKIEAPISSKKGTQVGQHLISERNERATKDNPLRYHERVYAVALPQPLDKLHTFLEEALVELRDGLDDAGHVVRIALYDHRYIAKPKSPPIATLAWCGWRDGAEVVFFPYAERPAASLDAAKRFIGGETLGQGNIPPAAPKRDLEEEKRAAQKAEEQKRAEAAKQAEEKRLAEKKEAEKNAAVAKKAEEAKAAEAAEAAEKAKRAAVEAKASEAVKEAEARKKADEQRAEDVKTAEKIAAAKRASTPSDAPGKVADRASAPPAGATRGSRRSLRDRKSVEPKVDPLRTTPGVPPAKSDAPAKSDNGSRPSQDRVSVERRVKLGKGSPELRPSLPAEEEPLTREERDSRLARARLELADLPPPVSLPGERVAGDDLVTDLFDEIAELHYLDNALDGAEFVLKLALLKLPSELGLVSLYDIDKREYVVVRQTGGERSALLLKINERADVPRRAMRKSTAVVLARVDTADATGDDRWEKIGTVPRSMICAPVEKAGRYLGLIELLNPLDGHAFSESDGHALTYIGQQYGEFLSNRGVTLDPEAVVASARRTGSPAP